MPSFELNIHLRHIGPVSVSKPDKVVLSTFKAGLPVVGAIQVLLTLGNPRDFVEELANQINVQHPQFTNGCPPFKNLWAAIPPGIQLWPRGGLILVGCFSVFLELRDEWARRKRQINRLEDATRIQV